MGFWVLIDLEEGVGDLGAGFVGLGIVAVDVVLGEVEAEAVEVEEEFVVEAGGVKSLREFLVDFWVVFEDLDGFCVFVSEEEFYESVVVGLESGGVTEGGAELDVLTGGEGFEDSPLFEEHALDVFDAGEDFECGRELVGLDEVEGGTEFMDDEFHPKFGGLVLDDEEHFVVVGGIREGVLGVENFV